MLLPSFRHAALLLCCALSTAVFASGAKRPVSDFQGNFVLLSGSVVTDSAGVASECPPFVRSTAFMGKNSKGKLVEAWMEIAGPSGAFMQFQNVNLGDVRLAGGSFRNAYTNSDSIVTELGREWAEERGPARKPKIHRSVDFSYAATFYGDQSFKVWTTSSAANCIYVLPHSR